METRLEAVDHQRRSDTIFSFFELIDWYDYLESLGAFLINHSGKDMCPNIKNLFYYQTNYIL